MATGAGLDTDRTRLFPELGTMIQRQTGLHLPLVDHLVKHRMLHLGPRFIADMGPADGNRDGLPGADVHAVFAQPGFHSSRKPKRNLLELAVEVPLVELLVNPGQLMQDSKITRAGALDPRTRLPGGCVQLRRKREELVLQRPLELTGHPGTEKSNDGFEHAVGSHGVALMNAKGTVTPRKHDGTVGMQLDSLNAAESQRFETVTKD